MPHLSHRTRPSTRHRSALSRRTFTAAALAYAGAAVIAPSIALGSGGGLIGQLIDIGGDSASSSSSTQSATSPVISQAADRPAILADLKSFVSGIQPAVADYMVADDFSNVTNDFYLSDEQIALLKANYFFVGARYPSDEFFEVYEYNRYVQRPNFVTADSMMHTYHLYFAHLLKNTERGYMLPLLCTLCDAMFKTSTTQLDALRGSEWEDAAIRCNAFFAVAGKLLGFDISYPDDVASLADAELALINAQNTITTSPLMETPEDYTQYIVRGYYTEDASLQQYFEAMMWLGRINFKQSDETADRASFLITLALTGDALSMWETIYSVTSFFCGASDDLTYYDYRPLIDQVYGPKAAVGGLAGDTASWTAFHTLTDALPEPQINSTPVKDTGTDEDHVAENKGFRFMGQRFSIDEAIFQQLVYNKIGENAAGEKRMLPNALDVPAALGSDTALSVLDGLGATAFSGYSENMEELRDTYLSAGDALWKASLYSQWLYTLQPLLSQKDTGYPMFMHSDAWARKDLQTYLGSYAELKHDTILYSKQIMSEMGGGGIDEKDDRGYVEPEPDVFGRLAALVDATSEGLSSLGVLDDNSASDLSLLSQLANQLVAIAEKELGNEALADDEYELIRSFGGQIEHFWEVVNQEKADESGVSLTSKSFPSAIIADVATDPNGNALEVGTGGVFEMYAIVPVDGSLRVASGPVYSFYQFSQPIAQRLTDSQWRQMMGIELNDNGSYNTPAVSIESWTTDFTL